MKGAATYTHAPRESEMDEEKGIGGGRKAAKKPSDVWQLSGRPHIITARLNGESHARVLSLSHSLFFYYDAWESNFNPIGASHRAAVVAMADSAYNDSSFHPFSPVRLLYNSSVEVRRRPHATDTM